MINVLHALMLIASFLFAIVLHECGHALVASWLGDRSPAIQERKTLSLRPHIDPLGLLMTIVLAFQGFPLPVAYPFPLVVPGPMALGWGNPVKPDPWKMRVGADTGVLLVALAGIVTSLLVGAVTTVLAILVAPFLVQAIVTLYILQFIVVFAVVNFSLAIFNLIPLYPLDGYQIVYALLPNRQASQFSRTAPYGPFIILFLFFLLPFLGRLAGLGDFPLFNLDGIILSGSFWLMSLGSPGLPGVYFLR